ncbi:MAG: hypothetical protein KJO17_10795 [Acidimicrobiia bacterium]|nr:hypothetical protein [Acidimicrobiia bacterium]
MKRIALVACCVLLLTACGRGDRQGAVGGAPLLTPAEAEGRSGTVAVQGFLWARPTDGRFRLCDASLESFPPQCGEPAVEVTGIDITEVAGVSFGENTFWAEAVRARGTLTDGTLAVEAVELNRRDATTGLSFRVIVPVEVGDNSVDFVALVTNSSTGPMDLRFLTGQSAEVTLQDPATGESVYQWSADRSFDQAIRDVTLAAGETLRFVLDEPDVGLAGGAYDLSAQLTATPAPGTVVGRLVVR